VRRARNAGVRAEADPEEESTRSNGARGPGADEQSDDELVASVIAGSRAHFDLLYARYFPRVYRFVHARIRSHADAEEIVQETFIAVFGSIRGYRGTASLAAWIYGIARNVLNSHLRSARRRLDRVELVDDEQLARAPASSATRPDAALDLDQFRRGVLERLDGLGGWQTEIFAMRHLENLSIPEISRRTRRSSDSVRSSLFRVKRVFLEQATADAGRASA
jgi:RNA polymerase sigma-70 factor (ECF subfamily)